MTMAYTIVNSYIPESLYKLKAPYTMKPENITIHNTYNDATAVNEIAYMTRNTTVVGYHVAIDDKQAIQAIPFTRNAFHAGDGQSGGNRKSIGIEICYSKSGGSRYVAAEENTIEYVAHVLKHYGWGIDRVKWHRDWSGKKCPHRIIDEGRTIQSMCIFLDNPFPVTKPAPAPSTRTNFKNCTDLKTVYPDGVPQGHAAYQSKMDRDKDGWACE